MRELEVKALAGGREYKKALHKQAEWDRKIVGWDQRIVGWDQKIAG